MKYPKIMQFLVGSQNGGAEEFFVKLCLALHRRGVQQKIVISPRPHHEKVFREAGCDYSVIRFGGFREPFARMHFYKLIKEFQPDVIIAWMNRAARRLPGKGSLTVGRQGGYYPVKWYRNCDYLIGNTPDICRHIIKDGFPENRTRMISNFGTAMELPAIDRQLLDTPTGSHVLFCAGRLDPSKGFDIVIQALARMPDAVLWLIGDGEERKNLQSLAQELGVFDRVRFTGWRNDISALLKASDVCVVPSRHEPLSNVILEAWHYSLPVVATTSEGPSWLIDHDENGLLVSLGNDEELVLALQRLFADKALQAKLVQGGRDKLNKHHSEEYITSQYLDFLTTIVTEKNNS